jgi:UDP-glucuronate 4-epimerase
MKVLVTGAAGFIGSHLCEHLLKNGHAVVGLDNMNQFYDPDVKKENILAVERTANQNQKEFVFYVGDIRHQDFLRQVFRENVGVDVIVHLAAMAGVRPSMENPLLYEEVNQLGTINVFEEARRAGIKKVIFGSSSSVYGNNEKTPFTETDPVDNPISHYAATKKAGELTAHIYHKIYGMSVACLRFFTVYGPRQRPDLAIHKFTKLIFAGKKIPIYGDGTKSRDFTYIADNIDGVYKAILWATESQLPHYEIFNLGESRTVTVNHLIDVLETSIGIKAEREYLPDMPGDVEKTFANIAKAKNVLGYDPHTQIEEGVPEFVKWFKTFHRL